jgi:hypothetical protein
VGGRRVTSVKPDYTKLKLSQNQIKNKRAGGRAQVVKHLPGKHEALDSIPCTTKRRGKRKKTLNDNLNHMNRWKTSINVTK